MYSPDTEIRHLHSADVFKLAHILDHNHSWKKLMSIIPKENSTDSAIFQGKYNIHHIGLIEHASTKNNRTCTEILFEEWGTSGRSRPTIRFLLEMLVKAELFRAADIVAEEFLNEPPPQRPLKGPAAKIDVSIPFDTEEIKEIDDIMQDVSYPGTKTLLENVQVPSDINNKDFYEKLGHNNKKVEVVQSDLMRFSSNTINVSCSDIPNLSQLGRSSDSDNISTSNGIEDCPIYEPNDIPEVNSIEIPALSALQNDSSSDVIPDVSALNFTEDDNENSLENESIPSGSTNSIEDSCLTPNLSLLDQSNHNDSSLTNVTGTSEENSFASSENIPSDNNIPVLSVLNN